MYDVENRLTKATLPTGQGVVEYAYDGDGNRVETKVTKGAVVQVAKHLVDRNRAFAEVVEERDGSGGLIARFVHGHDLEGPVSVTDGVGATKFYLTDALGSTRFLTDATGNVTDSYLYDAYGVETARTGITYNPYRFTGEAFDEDTKLTYLRARWMSAAMGRFLTVDPRIGRRTAPISLNKYAYAELNPQNKRDPSGEMVAMEMAGVSLQVSIMAGMPALKAGFACTIGAMVIYGAYSTAQLLLNEAEEEGVESERGELTPAEKAERSRERKAYKRRCGEQPPRNLNGCDLLRWLLQKNTDCAKMREDFSKKWYGDNDPAHVNTINDLKVNIARLTAEIASKCR